MRDESKPVIRRVDHEGKRFGWWLVGTFAGVRSGGATWNCVCDCGTERVAQAASLVRGKSTSCGCARSSGPQWTIEQHRASKKKYRQSTPGYRAKESRRWRQVDPERQRLYHRQTYFRTKYGLTIQDAEMLLAEQGGLCAVCRDPIGLGGKSGARVDHDHLTGRIRGILCNRCNVALGNFRDDPKILAAAIAYLEIGVSG